jgi:hypothetical protein
MENLTEKLAERLATRESARGGPSPVAEPPAEVETPEQDTDPAAEAPEGENPETPESENPEAPEGEVPEAGEIASLKDFAEAAGWDIADVYGLKFTLDTGEEVALGEVKDRLQTFTREREQVKAQTERLNEYAQQLQAKAQEYFTQRQAEGAEVTAAREAMMEVEARYNSVDWEGLAKADPGRAALLQQQLAVEYAGAKQHMAQAAQKEAQAVQQFAQQTRAQHAQALLKAIPEWQEPAKLQSEYPALQQYLGQWFNPNELQTIFDWRAITLARKAYLYDQGQVAMKDIEQKVKAAPKPVMKPGGGQPRGAAAVAKEQALVKKARESGRNSDKIAAAGAILQRALGGGARR